MPPELAGKIAAGEVVQRPSSVVKELLDNSIDAGADEITIVIENAGRTFIQISDNGCGMSREDLKLCFQQHATSKIRDVNDLYKIRTLGFRGEAMASIASISKVELVSKRVEDDTAHRIKIDGGQNITVEPSAGDAGTSVTVRDLFYNVPARRQFLRTDATEFRHILNEVQSVAIAWPEISFELIADGNMIYRLGPAERVQRFVDLFGRTYRSNLIEFKEETSYVTIRGYLGDPNISKKSRGAQFIFVNNRPVQHKGLMRVVFSVYDRWLAENEYPFFALFLNLKPDEVDVNVHPAKKEIKFDDERSIIRLTRSVVKKALYQYLKVPGVDSVQDGGLDTGESDRAGFSLDRFRADKGASLKIPSRINFEDTVSGRERKGFFDGEEVSDSLYGDPDSIQGNNRSANRRKQDSEESVGMGTSSVNEFWQLHNCYILTQTRTGLCFVDQFRAHQRIIYEKTLSATEEDLPGTQQLLFAQHVELSATDFALLEELLPLIRQMGFSIELLSGFSAVINGVPADIDIGNEKRVLNEMLEQYRELDGKLEFDARQQIAVAFASRTAIPRGKRLTQQEMELLIDQLFACEEPYFDPFGNPTLHYFSIEEIQKKFG